MSRTATTAATWRQPRASWRRFRPVKVIDLELGCEVLPITGLHGYGSVQALVRLDGRPLGWVDLPVTNGHCSPERVRSTLLDRLATPMIVRKADDVLRPGPPADEDLPSLTVAICTRDRTEQLQHCLKSIEALDYPDLDVIVVDNAPSGSCTEELVRSRFGAFRYVREPRPGLDWARNRAIAEARHEVVAFTDDDVVVDPAWARALGEVFAAEEEVMAVTGLVVPLELETEAQVLFEQYGGFGRGCRRTWHRAESHDASHVGAGRYGTGANMAFRRQLFDLIGPFDPALDVGTITNGGGDLEMFFRTLEEGHVLVYEPSAIVRHRHRLDRDQLRTQLRNNGVGFYSHLVRCALAYPDRRSAIARYGLRWFLWWSVRRLLLSFVRPGGLPRDLIVAELRGSLVGLGRYPRARRLAAQIARQRWDD